MTASVKHQPLLAALQSRALPPSVDTAQAQRWLSGLNAHPVMPMLGAQATLLDGGVVRFEIPALQDHHFGGFSGTRRVVNGAMLSALVDGVCGAVATLHATTGGAATVDISTQFMAATEGPAVQAYAAVVSRGRQLAFVEAIVVDGTGRSTVRATATCSLGKRA